MWSGGSISSPNRHIRSRRDVKGKFPINGSTLPIVTKFGTTAISLICSNVDRHNPGGHTIDHDPSIGIHLNSMFDEIIILLNEINQTINTQYGTMSGVILDHDWPRYLQPIGHLGVDLNSVDLRPVVAVLLDCIHNHCKRKCKQLIHSVLAHIERTHHNISTMTKSTIQIRRRPPLHLGAHQLRLP